VKFMLIQRKALAKIWENIDSDKLLLLNGARQTGKTTLMKMIKNKLVSERNVLEKNIFWYDLEKTEDLQLWSSQAAIFSFLPISEKTQCYIFIDEFQRSNGIGSILKVLHDHHPNFKIIITGSASWYLNIDESLAGRKFVFPVWPFSFDEFIKLNSEAVAYYESIMKNISAATPIGIEKVNNVLMNFLAFGGYPEVVLAEKKDKPKILSELLNSYLTRDIKIWNYAANSLQVKSLLSILAGQTGSLLEISALSKNSGLGRTAVINRLELLQNTFILHLISPYFTNKIKELTKSPKVFLVDTGLRNVLTGNFSVVSKTPDFGRLAENFVAAELSKNLSEIENVYHWRTPSGQETDFILKRGNNLIPIEVKSGVETSIPSGLKSFIIKYSPDTAYVLNWNTIKDEKLGNTKVFFRPLWWQI
jgi:uncharacterized protein